MPLFEAIDLSKYVENSEEFKTLNDLNKIIEYINEYRSVLEWQALKQLHALKADTSLEKIKLQKKLFVEQHYRKRCAQTIAALMHKENQAKLLSACLPEFTEELKATLAEFEEYANFLHLPVDGLIEISAIFDEVIARTAHVIQTLPNLNLNADYLASLEQQLAQFSKARIAIAHHIALLVSINSESDAITENTEAQTLESSFLTTSNLNDSLLRSFIVPAKDAACGSGFTSIAEHTVPVQSLINHFIERINRCFVVERPPIRLLENNAALSLFECHNRGEFLQKLNEQPAIELIDFNQYCFDYVARHGSVEAKNLSNHVSENNTDIANASQVFTLLDKLYNGVINSLNYFSPAEHSSSFTDGFFKRCIELLGLKYLSEATENIDGQSVYQTIAELQPLHEKLRNNPAYINELIFAAIQAGDQVELEQLLKIVRGRPACVAALNGEDDLGFTQLHWAAYFNNVPAWQLLQTAGLKIDSENSQQLSPIAYAEKIASAVLPENDWLLMHSVATTEPVTMEQPSIQAALPAVAEPLPADSQFEHIPVNLTAEEPVQIIQNAVDQAMPSSTNNADNCEQAPEELKHRKPINAAAALAEFRRVVKEKNDARYFAIGQLISEEAENLIYSGEHTRPSVYATHGFYARSFLNESRQADFAKVSKTKTINVADEYHLIKLLAAATAVLTTPTKDTIDTLITLANAHRPKTWERLLAATAILAGIALFTLSIVFSGGATLMLGGGMLIGLLTLTAGVYAHTKLAQQAALPAAALQLANVAAEPAVASQPQPEIKLKKS